MIRTDRYRSARSALVVRDLTYRWSPGSTFGEELVELLVALVHAGLHAAAEPGVAILERVDQGGRDQSRPAVAEVVQLEALERDRVRHPLPGEGLDDHLVRANLGEAAAEHVLLPVARAPVAERPAGPGVVVVDLQLGAARPDPAPEQLGIDVGPEDLLRRCVELALDADDRDVRVHGDGGLAGGGGGHGWSFPQPFG